MGERDNGRSSSRPGLFARLTVAYGIFGVLLLIALYIVFGLMLWGMAGPAAAAALAMLPFVALIADTFRGAGGEPPRHHRIQRNIAVPSVTLPPAPRPSTFRRAMQRLGLPGTLALFCLYAVILWLAWVLLGPAMGALLMVIPAAIWFNRALQRATAGEYGSGVRSIAIAAVIAMLIWGGAQLVQGVIEFSEFVRAISYFMRSGYPK